MLTAFQDRILPVDTAVALIAATHHVPGTRRYRDSQIAAPAAVHGLTVVTRNTADFANLNVALINPWTA